MSPPDNANDTAANETANQAPAADLPDVVPDFVSDVLGSINAGARGVGETISDVAPGVTPAEHAAIAVDAVAILPL